MIKPILQDVCYCEGRGPDLYAVRYVNEGKTIRAVEYYNPDDEHSRDGTRHLHFNKPQVYMWTPEEVYSSHTEDNYWAKFQPAAIISLGKSPWLSSFSPQHLAQCSHFQTQFYDQYLDIICEDIDYKYGAYAPEC